MSKMFEFQKQRQSSSSSTPATFNFRSRPFVANTKPLEVSPQNQQTPDLQTQQPTTERRGFNLAQISISPPSKPPPMLTVIQQKLASTQSGEKDKQEAEPLINTQNALTSQQPLQRHPEALQISKSASVQLSLKPLFRGMIADGSKPKIHSSARGLGVRVGDDIALEPGDTVAMTKNGKPAGMSVAPNTPINLPEHRRPPAFGGKGKDPVWKISDSELGQELTYSQDSPKHGVIGPKSQETPLVKYQDALASTQDKWVLEPEPLT